MAFAKLATMRWQPAVRTLPPYHDDPAYIGALKARVEASLAALDFEPQAIVASFHGRPARTLTPGGPYYEPCAATARRLGEARGTAVGLAFRPRSVRGKWL